MPKVIQEPAKACTLLAACMILLMFCAQAGAVDMSMGTAAPEFSLSSTSGIKLSLNQYRNVTLIVIYWWPEQVRSLMALKDGQDLLWRYEDRGLHVITVTPSADLPLLQSVLEEHAIGLPVLLDPDRILYSSYGIHVYPTTVIINKQGDVAYALPGHPLAYKTRLKAHLQYIIGEIDETTMHENESLHWEKLAPSMLVAHREYRLALNLTQAGLYDMAIESAQKSIDADSEDAQSHILLGFLYLESTLYERAADEFRKALALDPRSHDAKTGLGGSLIASGDADMAIDVLSSAIIGNPHPEMTYYELGRAHEQNGDLEHSMNMYKEAIENLMGNSILPSFSVRCR